MKATLAGRVLATIATVGLFLPQAGWAGHTHQLNSAVHPTQLDITSPSAAPGGHDVALADGGQLRGQVRDAQGMPVGRRVVQFIQNGQVIAHPTTDRDGRFQINSVRGGVYQISTGHNGGVYRLWTANTAPPSARPDLTLVAQPTVRGQCGCTDGAYCGACASRPSGFGATILNLVSNPWFVGAAIATAIAVPLALDDDDAS